MFFLAKKGVCTPQDFEEIVEYPSYTIPFPDHLR